MANLKVADNLDLPLDAVTQKLAFLAQSGAGKSYAAMKLAEQMLEHHLQVVALDPVGIWWGLRSSADGKRAGLPIVVFGGEHGDLPLGSNDGAIVADLLVERTISAVLDLSDFELPEMKRFVTTFAERFFQQKKRSRGPVHLFFEEVQTFAPQTPERDETTMLNRVERLARIGRNYGIGWSAISQRPQEVHKKVLNQAGTLFALRTVGRHERKAVADWVADKAQTEAEAKLLDGLPSLETGVARVWSPAFLRVTCEVRIGRRSTFDSSATPEVGAATVPRKLAPVDVSLLRAALAASIDKAKADDPKALRAHIVELERQVAAKPAAAAPPVKVEKIVQVPVLSDVDLKHLDDLEGEIRKRLDLLHTAITRVHERLAMNVVNSAGPVRAAIVRQPVPRIDPVPREHRRQPPMSAAPRPEAQIDSDWRPAPVHQKILDAVATLERLGVDPAARPTVGALSGYSATSGHFKNSLGALRSRGLLAYPGGDSLALTEAGRALANASAELATVQDLHECWYRLLDKAQVQLLRVLIDAYPDAISREALGDRSGYSHTSGHFKNMLGSLRTIGLATYPDPSSAAATELLFPAVLRSSA